MAGNNYAYQVTGDSPAVGGVAVTPSDTATLGVPTRALYVGAGGDLALVMQDGSTITLKAVLAGSLLPISIIAVKGTGTTASNIVALY